MHFGENVSAGNFDLKIIYDVKGLWLLGRVFMFVQICQFTQQGGLSEYFIWITGGVITDFSL